MGHYYVHCKDETGLYHLEDNYEDEIYDNIVMKNAYGLWSEFTAESFSNIITEKEGIQVEDSSPIIGAGSQKHRLGLSLDEYLAEAFPVGTHRIAVYWLGHYFARLLTDKRTVEYTQKTNNPYGATMQDFLLYKDELLKLKGILEKQLNRKEFWIADQALIEQIREVLLNLSKLRAEDETSTFTREKFIAKFKRILEKMTPEIEKEYRAKYGDILYTASFP